jgi:hypothetical protein
MMLHFPSPGTKNAPESRRVCSKAKLLASKEYTGVRVHPPLTSRAGWKKVARFAFVLSEVK